MPETLRKYIKIKKMMSLQKRGLFTHHPELVSPDLDYESPVFLEGLIQSNVKIGKHTQILNGQVWSNTVIGRYCSISFNVLIAPTNHPINFLTTSDELERYSLDVDLKVRTSVGNDVWIAANAFVQRGVKILDGAVVGAGAVVVKDVPPYAVVGGVPAKIIKYRFSQDIIDSFVELKWWDLDEAILRKLPEQDVRSCIRILEQIRKSHSSQDFHNSVL
jgi:acetyltransferase-like isoleucine patch superfamily enzyme